MFPLFVKAISCCKTLASQHKKRSRSKHISKTSLNYLHLPQPLKKQEISWPKYYSSISKRGKKGTRMFLMNPSAFGNLFMSYAAGRIPHNSMYKENELKTRSEILCSTNVCTYKFEIWFKRWVSIFFSPKFEKTFLMTSYFDDFFINDFEKDVDIEKKLISEISMKKQKSWKESRDEKLGEIYEINWNLVIFQGVLETKRHGIRQLPFHYRTLDFDANFSCLLK